MNFFIKWVLSSFLIMAIAWGIPGISISGFISALFVVLIMGVVNLLIRPVIQFISLPLNFITLGLFGLVINAFLFLLIAKFSPGFQIDGFWSGFWGALILSIFMPLIDKIKIIK